MGRAGHRIFVYACAGYENAADDVCAFTRRGCDEQVVAERCQRLHIGLQRPYFVGAGIAEQVILVRISANRDW